ncbi:hypothetical protein [Actinophytocola sediminis]
MPPRNYSRGDRAALSLLSRGHCYWQPVCTEPLFTKVNGRHKLALQIAHIRTDESSHERFMPGITKESVDSFDNLLFLCKPHHDTIDEPGAENIYPIDLLTKWKTTRESGQYDKLQGLRNVTEDRLVKLISQAQKDRDQAFTTVLNRLESSDREAAALLRELSDELEQVRRHRQLLDPDLVHMLNSAARNLRGLMDSASLLSSAGRDLRGLPDTASVLDRAANKLRDLPGSADMIMTAARDLSRAAARIEDARHR